MLQFKDGFDYLTVANIPLKWDTQVGGASLVTGVYGKGKAVQNINSVKTLASNVVQGFQAFHLFYGPVAAGTFASFRDAGTVQVDMRTDATGALFVTRNGTTIGSVSSTRLAANTWY